MPCCGLLARTLADGVAIPHTALRLQMVVVLDCRGASSMGLTRHVGLLKKLAVTFNQHYPVSQRAHAGWNAAAAAAAGRVGSGQLPPAG